VGGAANPALQIHPTPPHPTPPHPTPGFDAVSTLAEETKNPAVDMPVGRGKGETGREAPEENSSVAACGASRAWLTRRGPAAPLPAPASLPRRPLTKVGIVGCILIATIVYVAMAVCICLMVPYQVRPAVRGIRQLHRGCPWQSGAVQRGRLTPGPAAAAPLRAAAAPVDSLRLPPSLTPLAPRQLIDKGASFATAMVQAGFPWASYIVALGVGAGRAAGKGVGSPHHPACPLPCSAAPV
jgi:amino acid transporter